MWNYVPYLILLMITGNVGNIAFINSLGHAFPVWLSSLTFIKEVTFMNCHITLQFSGTGDICLDENNAARAILCLQFLHSILPLTSVQVTNSHVL